MNILADYKCDICNHTEEKWVNNYGKQVTAWPMFTCPSCTSGMLRKAVSAVTSVFKGKGFPSNDMKK